MNTRTFIISLTTLLLAAAVFVVWTINGLGSSSGPPSPSLAASSSKVPSTKTSHSSLHTSHSKTSRFTGLTDNSVRWQVRVDQLRRLDTTTLNQSEIDHLYSLLRHTPTGQKEAWWVVMNEVMEQIVKQEIAPERIIPEFCSIISDQSLDPVIRDYAIQHISIHLASTKAPPSQPLSSNLSPLSSATNVLKTLVAAIKAPENQHNSIPGTAFMAMIEASENPKHQEKVNQAFGELENYLTPLISGESTASLANRTSAINAVGLIKAEQYLPLLRAIATSEGVNDSAKLSSIASLGDFYASGAPSPSLAASSSNKAASTKSKHSKLNTENLAAKDREILEAIAASNTKFKYAATAALNKFQN